MNGQGWGERSFFGCQFSGFRRFVELYIGVVATGCLGLHRKWHSAS